MGALLQCYALSSYLNSLDNIECEVIQYFPKEWKATWDIIKKPRTFRDVLKIVYELLDFKNIKKRKERNKKTRNFIKRYIPLTSTTYYTQSSIIDSPPKADAYICGSDQIWNLKIFQDPTYFLSFTAGIDCLRIAYAPSIAEDWTADEAQKLKKYIDRFDALSIREIGNLEIIKSITSKPVQVVIDPVFLLSRKHWLSITKQVECKEPYILCYFLSVPPLAIKLVNKIKEVTGFKVVYLNHNAFDKIGCDEEIRDYDPIDFISYISKASVVCTNSFHCSAFSIIFERNFFFVPGMRNKRVENLQEIFHLGDRFATKENIELIDKKKIVIDYSLGEENGDRYINESKEFLVNALNINKKFQ